MSETWEQELQRRVIDFILRDGSPVDPQAGYYSWRAHDWERLYRHMAECSPRYEGCTWADAEWTEFRGTFADDNECSGLQAIITCACAEIAGRAWRYRGSYGDLIRGITGER